MNWFDRLQSTRGYLIFAKSITAIAVLVVHALYSPIWLFRRHNRELIVLVPAGWLFRLVGGFTATRFGNSSVARVWLSGDKSILAVRHWGIIRFQQASHDGNLNFFVKKWGYEFPVFYGGGKLRFIYHRALWDWVFLGGSWRLDLVICLHGLNQELSTEKARVRFLDTAFRYLFTALAGLKGSSPNYQELYRYVTEVIEALEKRWSLDVLQHVVVDRQPEVGGRRSTPSA